jgi:hypothetical protein
VETKAMTDIRVLKTQLKNLTVTAALLCVEQRAPNKIFMWGAQEWTPKQAGAEWEPGLMNMGCEDFGVIRFYGGPPGEARWYAGSILSMLCDLILFDESTKGWTDSERIASYA